LNFLFLGGSGSLLVANLHVLDELIGLTGGIVCKNVPMEVAWAGLADVVTEG